MQVVNLRVLAQRCLAVLVFPQLIQADPHRGHRVERSGDLDPGVQRVPDPAHAAPELAVTALNLLDVRLHVRIRRIVPA